MGCGVSNIAGTAEGENLFDFSRRNTIVDKPNVPVQIGEGVRKIDSEHRLVFVFGRWKIPSALNCYQLCYCHGCLNLLGELSVLVFSLLLWLPNADYIHKVTFIRQPCIAHEWHTGFVILYVYCVVFVLLLLQPRNCSFDIAFWSLKYIVIDMGL